MTAVFHRLGAKGYEMINTVNGYDDDEVLRDLCGPSRKHEWKPILVRRCRPSRREAFKAADLPYDHDVLIMRASAVDALRDILETHGEVLPLATEDGVELFVFNPRFVIDALDRERSTYEQIPGTSTLWIRKYVFIESAIREIDIFKMPMDRGDYYSDRFVERVKAAKLKGTEFIKLWSSDDIAQSGA